MKKLNLKKLGITSLLVLGTGFYIHVFSMDLSAGIPLPSEQTIQEIHEMTEDLYAYYPNDTPIQRAPPPDGGNPGGAVPIGGLPILPLCLIAGYVGLIKKKRLRK